MDEKEVSAETVKCKYCGEIIPVVEAEKVLIWINRGTREEWFCAEKSCAAYYQMGAEG